MATLKTVKIENDLIDHVKHISQEKKFIVDSNLFYEGQVPIVAYLVVKGCIELFRNKKVKFSLNEGSIVGVKELLSHTPSKLSARVQADSVLCFLDKSTLKEIIDNPHSHLRTVLSEASAK
jgi:CRP-like cAMP-binding protein